MSLAGFKVKKMWGLKFKIPKYSEAQDSKRIFATRKKGDLSEWLKEHAWKVCIRETVSRVRIPQSPLFIISQH